MTKPEKKIKDAIANHGVRGPNLNGEYQTCCPWCLVKFGSPDMGHRLQLNPGKSVYHCYRCETGGRADVADLLGTEPQQEIKQDGPTESLGPPEGFYELKDPSTVLQPFRDYMAGRNLLYQAQQAGVGACLSGRYAGRVIVPYYQHLPHHADPEWSGFAARAITPGVEPRYLYPRGMDRRHAVWGMHLPWQPDLYLVEGVFDALPLWPRGRATFGKNVTEDQLDWFIEERRMGSKLVVCLDGDAWEECQALKMRLVLRGAEDTTWCRLPPGKDPGQLGWEVRKFIVTT